MGVFPAGAGMILKTPAFFHVLRCVPRRRGDDPQGFPAYGAPTQCSPQARG